MTFGVVILFDVVATLGGGAFATLVLDAATLSAGRGCVVAGCVLVPIVLLSRAPAKIEDKY